MRKTLVHYLFLPLFIFIASFSQVGCLYFNYTTFDDNAESDFIQRSSYLAGGAIQVTPDFSGQTIFNRSGRILFGRPFRLYRDQGLVRATFNTTFVLNITPRTDPAGEGLAFILTRDQTPSPPNSFGQWLGIVNDTSGSAKIVAVEFDTRQSYPDDLDGNHVGIDLGSIKSVEQVSLSGNDGVNLSSGSDVAVRIQYDGVNLTVFVGERRSPVISREITLSSYLPEMVYVGFSGSTSEFTQLNCIKSWEFKGSKIGEGKKIWVWIVVAIALVIVILIVLVN